MVQLKCRWNFERACYVSEAATTVREAVVEAIAKTTDLRGADLRGADLGGADLGWANLRGADLRGANLGWAKVNWQSHDLIAEILRREAGVDIEKRKVAGLILVSWDWCWGKFLAIESGLRDWALNTLSAHVVYGDGAPEILVKHKAAKTAE